MLDKSKILHEFEKVATDSSINYSEKNEEIEIQFFEKIITEKDN